MTSFLSVYKELMCSVKPCVMDLADSCLGCGLISQDSYEKILKKENWIDSDKARCLLDNVRQTLSVTPQALNTFVSVLLEAEDCKCVAEKIRKLL